MVKTNFFEYLDFALQFAPATPEEKEIRAKLARIGVGAGKTFDFKDLPMTHKLEIGLGMKEGEKRVEKFLARPAKNDQRLEGRRDASAITRSSTATG